MNGMARSDDTGKAVVRESHSRKAACSFLIDMCNGQGPHSYAKNGTYRFQIVSENSLTCIDSVNRADV